MNHTSGMVVEAHADVSGATDSAAPASEAGAGAPRARRADVARRWLTRPLGRVAEALGRRYLRRLTGFGSLTETLSVVPERMHLVANQTRLVLEMLEDAKAGRLRDLPWRSVAIAGAAALYTLSPADVIPDVVPLLGTLDDLAVVAIAVRLIERDLRAYCRLKGYPEEEYFERAKAERRRKGRRARAS